MILFKRVKIRSYEMGLHFRDGEFKGLLIKGRHWLLDLLRKVRMDIVSQRDPWLVHDKLDMIVKSGVQTTSDIDGQFLIPRRIFRLAKTCDARANKNDGRPA
jgi:hypothetical protein